MNKEEMMEYFKVYNSRDYNKAISVYYSEDAVFESADYKYEGKENIINFLTESHKGIEEVLQVKQILIDGNSVAAELEADLQITADKPDFHIQPVRKGDSIMLKMSAFYDIEDGKISHIRIYRFLKCRR